MNKEAILAKKFISSLDEYKTLVKIWHPDMASGDREVFDHIQKLHDNFNNGIEIDTVIITRKNGTKFKIHYLKTYDIVIGTAYLSATKLSFHIKSDYDELITNAVKVMKDFKYPNNDVKESMLVRQPKFIEIIDTDIGKLLVIDRPSNLIRLRDVLDYYKQVPAKHVAWIISELLNYACYMQYANITHNDLSLDSIFICPEKHTIAILGGWWFSVEARKQMRFLPDRTIRNTPDKLISTKIADSRIDLGLIRLLGRELLGDDGGTKLVNNTDIPKPFCEWLRVASHGSASTDYREWPEILKNSWGPPKFQKMDLNANEIYT